MIDNMYSIMARINEIRTRFGLSSHENHEKVMQAGTAGDSKFSKMTDEAVKLQKTGFQPLETGRLSEADIKGIAEKVAGEKNISADLVKAVISTESGYNPAAVSKKGAMGLMQLMPGTAGEYGVKNPFDPEQNIRGGVNLLSDLLEHYSGDYKKALAAYNAGKGAVDRKGGSVPYKETGEYVKKVIDLYVGNRE